MRVKDFIDSALRTLAIRGVERDSPEGERSMHHAVRIYNAITGQEMTERQGWTFMQALKLARAERTKKFNADDFVDLIGYTALRGELQHRQHYGVCSNGKTDKDENRPTYTPRQTHGSPPG